MREDVTEKNAMAEEHPPTPTFMQTKKQIIVIHNVSFENKTTKKASLLFRGIYTKLKREYEQPFHLVLLQLIWLLQRWGFVHESM